MIQTNPEQQAAAIQAVSDAGWRDGFVCLAYESGPNWTWKVVKVCQLSAPADEWWESQGKMARVYGVNRGKVWIRNAK